MVTMANRVIKLENPRFTFSDTFTRTNFTLGDDHGNGRSTYRNDYVLDTACRDDLHHAQATPILPRVKMPDGTTKQSRTTSQVDKHVGQSLPRVQPGVFQQSERIINLEKKKQMQSTSVKFGNDGSQWSTAYETFTAGGTRGKKRQPCVPPQQAEILPPPCRRTHQSGRSIVNSDYTYFGPTVSNNVLSGRRYALDTIQRIHTTDSVERTLLGRRRKMLTCSMVDYRHPHHSVHGNNKPAVTPAVSPYVRADSIWNRAVVSCGQCALPGTVYYLGILISTLCTLVPRLAI